MTDKLENVKTETWHRIIRDLKSSGFEEVYQYDGMDAGIDYNRRELMNRASGELIIFEWDNWTEGEITAAPQRLEELREKYGLPRIVEIE